MSGSRLQEVPLIEVHYAEAEHAVVEDRGVGFGKIYVYWPGTRSQIKTVLLWSPRGVMIEGVREPDKESVNRGIRALATIPRGRAVLGIPEPDLPPLPPASPPRRPSWGVRP